ncbi:MAG: hypothetical protein JO179_04680 [Solirubrobacterales bacterium]|nr:hypothetical protein [Solirubrobacterales bacterium]
MRRTVPPSAEIQASIDRLLSKGMVDDPQKLLSELARLGARLIIQRAVEDEFDSWLGRARYERRPERQRGLRYYESGLRNGFRPRHVQTAEGELGRPCLRRCSCPRSGSVERREDGARECPKFVKRNSRSAP